MVSPHNIIYVYLAFISEPYLKTVYNPLLTHKPSHGMIQRPSIICAPREICSPPHPLHSPPLLTLLTLLLTLSPHPPPTHLPLPGTVGKALHHHMSPRSDLFVSAPPRFGTAVESFPR